MPIKVIKFSDKFYDNLIEFNKRIYPERKEVEKSLLFKIYSNPFAEGKPDFFIVLDEEKIIGQYLLFPSKYCFNKNIDQIVWGCDYYVDEKYRGTGAGLILAQETLASFNHIGMGSTKIAKKIHLALNEKSIGWLFQFIYFRNPVIPFCLKINKLYNINIIQEKKPVFPEDLILNNNRFIRLNSAPLLNCEFWNKDLFEMTRSKEFLQWRFFSEPEKYSFYFLENNNVAPVYFVVRSFYRNGINFLFLVDYRVSIGNPEGILLIIKALKKLLKKNGLNAILCTSSLSIMDLQLKRNLFINIPSKATEVLTNLVQFIDPVKVKNRSFTFITPADSDFDMQF